MGTPCSYRSDPAGTLSRVSVARAGLFIALVLGSAHASRNSPRSLGFRMRVFYVNEIGDACYRGFDQRAFRT